MPHDEFSSIQAIHDFPSLIKYLRTELGWPVDEEQADDLTFDYRAAELGLDDAAAVRIRTIKQLRPLTGNQPWGIFWIDFEPKSLPVLVMRRILNRLVQKQRGQQSHQAAWDMRDLLFISATGSGSERGVSFAHFERSLTPGPSPVQSSALPGRGEYREQLRTFSWDVRETHLFYIKNFKLNQLRWPDNPANANDWRAQWSAAFTVEHRYVVKTAQQLAGEMARIAGEIREAVQSLYAAEHVGGPLHQLHLSLKMTLITDLNEADFADMYAQTVAYGLFAARATRQGEFSLSLRERDGVRSNGVEALIAHTNPFLRELLGQLMNQADLDFDGLGVSELVALLHQVNMEEILMDFGRQKRGEDPVIHFYETFMKQYDPVQKTRRGEFYTPDPVVSFIVRSVDYLLRTEFDCPDGLMSTLSTDGSFAPVFLDPATGTGTFLKYIIEVIWQSFYEKHKKLSAAQRKAKWNEYVRASLLPRLYGFELKMSPYTIAHLKLGLTLQQYGFEFQEGERLRVFLSNTLQPAHEVPRVDTPALAHEVLQANEVKANAPVTVVIGNPPYAGHSSNASRDHRGDLNFIGNLMQDYYKVDSKPLGEKNPKWLQNDYVKFLRFGQWRVTEKGSGILAFITDNSYLDNPTFRGMRQQLFQAFSEIYILNLHGNSNIKETAPDGAKDENVFDIQQGVAICLMVKAREHNGPTKVWYMDLYGLRAYKYEWLLTHHQHSGSVKWQGIFPETPYYLFIPHDTNLRGEYDSGWKVTDIMPLSNMGITTGKDDFATSVEKTDLENKIRLLADRTIQDNVLRSEYGLQNTSSFSLVNARNWATSLQNVEQAVKPISYRFFDERFVIYSSSILARDRFEISRNFLQSGKNIGLVTFRAIRELPWQHVACTKNIIAKEYISSLDNCFVFPLYVYPEATKQTLLFNSPTFSRWGERRANISKEYVNMVATKLGLRYLPEGVGDLTTTFGPENIFHYLYTVFHSPTYRTRYAEFLKIDFPRLPLTSNLALFRQLCGLGQQLVGLHLLESPLLEQTPVRFSGQGDGRVATGHPKYQDGVVLINPQQGFADVPQEVWEFHVGGYQVCNKWLKDRRGRVLSTEDIAHYQKIVVALGETIRLMGDVDEAIESAGGWPIQ